MTIDHRLHHAAREIREIEIDAPPLPSVSAGHVRRSKIPAVAASLLVVLGGIGVWNGMADVPASQSEADVSAALETSAHATSSRSVVGPVAADAGPAIGPREELALITALVEEPPTPYLHRPAGAV